MPDAAVRTLSPSRALRVRRTRLPFSARALAAAAALAALAALPAGALERSLEKSVPAPPGTEIEFENLAGKITMVAASGENLAVHATVHAEASSSDAAARLADSLRLATEGSGSHVTIYADYPTDDHDVFCYPRPGHDEGFSIFGGSRSHFRYRGRSVTVVSSPTLSAVTLYADVRIEVPAGVHIKVKSHVGDLDSSAVAADQTLDTSSGDVTIAAARGRIAVDTGSGDVNASSIEGDVAADTGSGHVVFEHVRGKASADTGSGDVTMRDVEGERLYADTGSGDVRLERVRGSLLLDTGSGGVKGHDVVVVGRMKVDTGSGDVHLAGDFSKVDDLYVDTGSGDLVLEASALPSGRYEISTGSGDIDTSYPDLTITRVRRDYIEARLGEGDVHARLETGSGDITLRKSH